MDRMEGNHESGAQGEDSHQAGSKTSVGLMGGCVGGEMSLGLRETGRQMLGPLMRGFLAEATGQLWCWCPAWQGTTRRSWERAWLKIVSLRSWKCQWSAWEASGKHLSSTYYVLGLSLTSFRSQLKTEKLGCVRERGGEGEIMMVTTQPQGVASVGMPLPPLK